MPSLLSFTSLLLFANKLLASVLLLADAFETFDSFSEKLLNCLFNPVELNGGLRFELSCTGISIVNVPSDNSEFLSRLTSAPCGKPISLLNSPTNLKS